jgi:DNA modification methylase
MNVTIKNGDCRTVLKELPSESVQCVVTSPPYWGLRDYGHADQIGLEPTPQAYVETMRQVFAEVWRVLRDDGTVWLNLGDSYARMQENNVPQSKNRECVPPSGTGRIKNAGLKPKDLVGIPWRVAFALQADGWYLRSDIIWHKPNPMPESVTDRCTKSHEYIFMLTKSAKYYFDAEAIMEPAAYGEQHANKTTSWGPNGKMADNGIGKSNREKYEFKGDNHTCHNSACTPGQTPQGKALKRMSGESDEVYFVRNKRDVWTVQTAPCKEAHFATFPPDLIKPRILAGTKPDDVVLDPFGGSGTTGMVALELGRQAILIELNPEYAKLCDERCATTPGLALA